MIMDGRCVVRQKDPGWGSGSQTLILCLIRDLRLSRAWCDVTDDRQGTGTRSCHFRHAIENAKNAILPKMVTKICFLTIYTFFIFHSWPPTRLAAICCFNSARSEGTSHDKTCDHCFILFYSIIFYAWGIGMQTLIRYYRRVGKWGLQK